LDIGTSTQKTRAGQLTLQDT